MNIAIINCFETYNNRVQLIKSILLEYGFTVNIIQSNFHHMSKKIDNSEEKNKILVDTKPYSKNLSFKRLKSHNRFSKDAIRILNELKPDIIYSLIPPNSLAKEVIHYKKKNPEVKVIFDLIDLWPETYPIKYFKNNFFFYYWKRLRDIALYKADRVITECDYFQEVLKFEQKKISADTLYMARKDNELIHRPNYIKDEVHLCYLGSVNNIIDIYTIKKVITDIQSVKPVVLHIIGDGEKMDSFTHQIELTGALVVTYGKVYDAYEKQQIFDKCHYGINIMKPTVVVGLTMKSIDYFEAGLPIINTIPGDTEKMVNQYNVGINYSSISRKEFLNKIRENSMEKFNQDRIRARNVYKSELSENVFKSKFLTIFNAIKDEMK